MLVNEMWLYNAKNVLHQAMMPCIGHFVPRLSATIFRHRLLRYLQKDYLVFFLQMLVTLSLGIFLLLLQALAISMKCFYEVSMKCLIRVHI